MRNRLRNLVPALAVTLALAGVLLPGRAHAADASPPDVRSSQLRELAVTLQHLAPGLDLRPIERALEAARNARAHGVPVHSDLLTVIDYTRPSWQPRLWVFDTVGARLLFSDRVAHGANTGEAFARHFSNALGSKQTSLGLFLTGDPYVGDNGYSLRLHGLDRGVNDRAYERAVVMHGAPYVSDQFVREHGRIGRSWGCPAVSQEIARPLIETIRGGSLVYAYYEPDAASN